MLFYVETGLLCTLIEARTAAQARRIALREMGTYVGVDLVRKATEEDIAWVTAMQGRRSET
ncbi:MAG: hypothetical protein JRI59_08425 [Deltaproteobacteria bacterium]|nr:hypothetical protein [Deltaproteobacteria bacterium]